MMTQTHRFNQAIRRARLNAQLWPRFAYALMMQRIDRKRFAAVQQRCQQAIRFDIDWMCCRILLIQSLRPIFMMTLKF